MERRLGQAIASMTRGVYADVFSDDLGATAAKSYAATGAREVAGRASLSHSPAP